MSIYLHKEKGINARLTMKWCVLCGKEKESNDLVLIGNQNQYYTCLKCDTKFLASETESPIGNQVSKKCPKCNHSRARVEERLKEMEPIRMPEFQICKDCKEELIEKFKEKGKELTVDEIVVIIEIDESKSNSEFYFTGRSATIPKDNDFVKDQKKFLIDDSFMFMNQEAFEKFQA